jgi:glycosyltransferase involved in cell wall biosynthesis
LEGRGAFALTGCRIASSTLGMGKKAIIVGPLPPPYGDVAVFTETLFESIKNRGVKLWTYGGRRVNNEQVSFFRPRRLGIVWLLLKEGYQARITDSSHYLVEHPNILLVPLWVLLKRLLRFHWVKVVHDGSLIERHKRFSPLQSVLFKTAVRSVDEFAPVSPTLSEWLTEIVKVEQPVATRNALLPLPGLNAEAKLPEALETALARYDKIVISTGVFIPNYGFREVAEAIDRVRKEAGEKIGLVLVDGGFVRDDSYRDEILRDRDWIVPLEQVPHPQVLHLFKRSDLFVRGFRYEGYGLSRIEAIWCGTPVVAARGEESRGMLLYDFEDLERLVEQIKRGLVPASRDDIAAWADVFQREAQANLAGWETLIDPQVDQGGG